MGGWSGWPQNCYLEWGWVDPHQAGLEEQCWLGRYLRRLVMEGSRTSGLRQAPSHRSGCHLPGQDPSGLGDCPAQPQLPHHPQPHSPHGPQSKYLDDLQDCLQPQPWHRLLICYLQFSQLLLHRLPLHQLPLPSHRHLPSLP